MVPERWFAAQRLAAERTRTRHGAGVCTVRCRRWIWELGVPPLPPPRSLRERGGSCGSDPSQGNRCPRTAGSGQAWGSGKMPARCGFLRFLKAFYVLLFNSEFSWRSWCRSPTLLRRRISSLRPTAPRSAPHPRRPQNFCLAHGLSALPERSRKVESCRAAAKRLWKHGCGTLENHTGVRKPCSGGVLGLPAAARGPGRRWGRDTPSLWAAWGWAWGEHPWEMVNPCGFRGDGGWSCWFHPQKTGAGAAAGANRRRWFSSSLQARPGGRRDGCVAARSRWRRGRVGRKRQGGFLTGAQESRAGEKRRSGPRTGARWARARCELSPSAASAAGAGVAGQWWRGRRWRQCLWLEWVGSVCSDQSST